MRKTSVIKNYSCVVLLALNLATVSSVTGQQQLPVKVVKEPTENKIDVFIGNQLFTSFLFPDSLEKPVLFPIRTANNLMVTRGFPLETRPGDPTDHPHHIGLWLNFENVNGLDFWNNSFAIPAEKKSLYGWIRTEKIDSLTSGQEGTIIYHANWTNQKKEVLLVEKTTLVFSGSANQRIIDRITVLKAVMPVRFTDAKDGLLGLRLAHELQIPAVEEKTFTDDKGNATIVKKIADSLANGNYLTSEGLQGDAAWGTRASWCKVYGKIGTDSVSVTIMDHSSNPNYPTWWHARGYGLFAANPLGEKVFSNGKKETNLELKPGASVSFRYRVLIDNGLKTLTPDELNVISKSFEKKAAGY